MGPNFNTIWHNQDDEDEVDDDDGVLPIIYLAVVYINGAQTKTGRRTLVSAINNISRLKQYDTDIIGR